MKYLTLLLVAVAAIATTTAIAGCGSNDEPGDASLEQRIDRERKDAASDATQRERLKAVEKELQTLRKSRAATGGKVAAPSQGIEGESSPPTTGGWPAWTVVLKSSGTRSEAVSSADRASRAGLPETGVLKSDNHPSLRPGYWVAFSGVTDREGANQIQATARRAGFSDAYARYVSGE